MADMVQEPQLPSRPFEHGDRLDQQTFHVLYETMPEDFRAELIGGTAYVASPLKRDHSRYHVEVIDWLRGYEKATPGTETHLDATAILGPKSEPQPGKSSYRCAGPGAD